MMSNVVDRYLNRIEDDEQNVSSADDMEAEESDEEESDEEGDDKEAAPAELWDLLRPLIGNCELRLLKFEDKEAQVQYPEVESRTIAVCVET